MSEAKEMPYGHFRNPCEWNAENDRPARFDEVHAEAAVSVGANGQWHLCEKCAALPRFKRFTKRKELSK